MNQDLSLYTPYPDLTYHTLRILPESTRDIIPVRTDKKACVKISLDVTTGIVHVEVFLVDLHETCAKFSSEEQFFLKTRLSSLFIISPSSEYLYIGLNRLIGSLSRQGSSAEYLKVEVEAKKSKPNSEFDCVRSIKIIINKTPALPPGYHPDTFQLPSLLKMRFRKYWRVFQLTRKNTNYTSHFFRNWILKKFSTLSAFYSKFAGIWKRKICCNLEKNLLGKLLNWQCYVKSAHGERMIFLP